MLPARDNPFATRHVLQLRYQFRRPGDDGWPGLLDRLEALRYRAAISGPRGAGKTTLLEELGQQLQERGFRIHPVFLNEQNRAWPSDVLQKAGDWTGRDIVLMDGCEQLSALRWYRFRWQTRRAGGLVITTHRPCRLPLLRLCETDPDLLGDLVRQLCGDASPAGPIDIRRLYDTHRGNLRDALRALYDTAAER